MACTKYEYVKKFESNVNLLPNTWIVVRIDGHAFHRFSTEHQFQKPNDIRALHLMNTCAKNVMKEIDDIIFSYGQSDEFSFVLKRQSNLWSRREPKLISNIVSLFTSNYVLHWKDYFNMDIIYPPSFDSRAVCYPTDKNLRDYICWRQADCHINNLYNTAFWALVQDGNSTTDAEKMLKITDSAAKNELLFQKFNINYAHLPEIFRKGSSLYKELTVVREVSKSGVQVERNRKIIQVTHEDVIGDAFWEKSRLLVDQ